MQDNKESELFENWTSSPILYF